MYLLPYMEDLNLYVCVCARAFILKFFLYFFFPLFLPSTILLVFSHFGMCVGVVYERVCACLLLWVNVFADGLGSKMRVRVWYGAEFFGVGNVRIYRTPQDSLSLFTHTHTHTHLHAHAGAQTKWREEWQRYRYE